MFERLANADRDFVKSQVSNGFYTSEIEVIRDAVRKMREEKSRISRFHTAVMEGDKAIKEGRTRELTPDVMDELINTALVRAKAGEPYHSTHAIPDDET